jgi:hypothetical protein
MGFHAFGSFYFFFSFSFSFSCFNKKKRKQREHYKRSTLSAACTGGGKKNAATKSLQKKN